MVEMIDCCTQKEINFTHREFDNDFPIKQNLALRVVKAALPLISLYQPVGRIIAVGAGISRSITLFSGGQILELALSVSAVAMTILMRPVGMAITTCHDIAKGAEHLYQAAKGRDMAEVAKELTRLASNVIYLAALASHSLEIEIASLALLALSQAASSVHNFSKGRWIEGTSDALMAAVRIKQLIPKVEMLKLKREIEAAIQQVFVGTLAGKWQFPSDHLPVGIEVNGTKIVSWNVMNTAYMSWVKEKDSQGLNGSLLTDLDYAVQPDGLTARDQRVVELVGSIINKYSDIVALQECSEPFLAKLESSLPANWRLVRSSDTAAIDQDVVLYNSSRLAYLPERSETTYTAYPSVPNRPLQNAAFATNDKVIRVVNSHIPGDPALPARDEFARYVGANYKQDETLIALGDNNFERHEMIDAYKKAGFSCFTLFSPWNTNIDPVMRLSKAIDHLFVIGASSSRQLTPSEILDSDSRLEETISLLS